jgi:hypothetical protein
MSTLILLGAGASAFSGDCLPAAPPLGKGLFAELVKLGGVAASVGSDLAKIFMQDFEAGMAAFSERPETESSALLREMARYFVKFEPGASNLYIKLLSELPLSRRRITFATLNYELLLELAANRLGFRISYTTRNTPKGNITLLKPHGSCNFLPDVPPLMFRDFSVRSAVPNATGGILNAPIRPATPSEVIAFCDRENVIAPAMAMYARGKRMLFCGSPLRDLQAEYATATAEASRIYVVGVGVNPEDEHIWQPLARAAAPIYYVGPDATAFVEWAKQSSRKRAIHLATSFDSSIPEIVRHHTR